MTPADLKALAAVMAEMRIVSVKFPCCATGEHGSTHGVAEVTLHVSAFAAPATSPPTDPPEPEPTRDELLYASSVPVTEFERTGKDPG